MCSSSGSYATVPAASLCPLMPTPRAALVAGDHASCESKAPSKRQADGCLQADAEPFFCVVTVPNAVLVGVVFRDAKADLVKDV